MNCYFVGMMYGRSIFRVSIGQLIWPRQRQFLFGVGQQKNLL